MTFVIRSSCLLGTVHAPQIVLVDVSRHLTAEPRPGLLVEAEMDSTQHSRVVHIVQNLSDAAVVAGHSRMAGVESEMAWPAAP